MESIIVVSIRILTVPAAASRKGIIRSLSFRNKIALFISIVSFLFFFPGIYLSMLSISTSGSISAELSKGGGNILGKSAASGSEQHQMAINIFDTTRSILKTVHDLWVRDYFFVASMIFLFSIVIPLTKGTLLSYIFFTKNDARRRSIFSFIKAIGKWSMCDVFIVAIFLAYLSTGASKTENVKSMVVMGHSMSVDVLAGMHAHLHVGFWCFLTYCLLTLLALQLYDPY
jgi:hypothetical protein